MGPAKTAIIDGIPTWMVQESENLTPPHGIVYTPFFTNTVSRFRADIKTHHHLLDMSSNWTDETTPLYYMRVPARSRRHVENSSNLVSISERLTYFEQVENQLNELVGEEDASGDCVVEQGAIDTALVVVRELKNHNYAPPEITWHGGDAVVMLWGLGETTYAVTVTEGEVGYVVRRNKKAIKTVDSLSVDRFRLEDLR